MVLMYLFILAFALLFGAFVFKKTDIGLFLLSSLLFIVIGIGLTATTFTLQEQTSIDYTYDTSGQISSITIDSEPKATPLYDRGLGIFSLLLGVYLFFVGVFGRSSDSS